MKYKIIFFYTYTKRDVMNKDNHKKPENRVSRY